MPTRGEVTQFLGEFNAAITLDLQRWVPRSVDRHQQLLDIGMTENLALKTIQNLGPDNYSRGPSPDDTNTNRFVWIFGVEIEGVEVYIKLALWPHKRKNVTEGWIWSFHRAQHAMQYPLREESNEEKDEG